MPIVTKIESQKKSKDRFNIYLDGVYSFPLPADVVVKYRLKVGDAIEGSQIPQILADGLADTIYAKVLNFVSYQPRTEKEVKTKASSLLDKLTTSDSEIVADESKVQDVVVDKLKSAGLLDDVSYARQYIGTARNSRYPTSRKKIKMFLLKKGISKEVIEEYLNEETFSFDDEIKTARKLFDKKVATLKTAGKALDSKSKAKIWRFMLGKGYAPEVISALFDTIPQV